MHSRSPKRVNRHLKIVNRPLKMVDGPFQMVLGHGKIISKPLERVCTPLKTTHERLNSVKWPEIYAYWVFEDKEGRSQMSRGVCCIMSGTVGDREPSGKSDRCFLIEVPVTMSVPLVGIRASCGL